ncbi:hypothetical protein TSUD_114950 [Trifolium subterraneum]|uniref:Uncharacterized protein n=1 Tax=Trifolium subterraneum TaxID=3900 RepID=A0A2Z6NVE7_TRISU|nr:hypothetical protein TSUD_114950 [Trifolium subterraneum]
MDKERGCSRSAGSLAMHLSWIAEEISIKGSVVMTASLSPTGKSTLIRPCGIIKIEDFAHSTATPFDQHYP